MGQMAQAYLGDADPRTLLASPHYAEVEGFPPLLIQVGSEEVLLSDAQALAEKAEAAGVPADLEVWDGMYHVWHLGSRMLPEARRAIKRIGDWLQHRWAEVGDHAA
jgi:acetyl esterase/lipase